MNYIFVYHVNYVVYYSEILHDVVVWNLIVSHYFYTR